MASGLALAQTAPEDTLRGHFAAIQAEDYVGADQYFSAAFLSAFKTGSERDRDYLYRYYYSRKVQLEPGYDLVEVAPLADEGRETCRIVVDFRDPDPDAPVTVAERMYYYLIREKVSGGPLVDRDGKAWRIDICDAIKYDTLAEARRRPYLYSREAWDESGSHELKSMQGLFQIYVALAAFYQQHGQYPFRLLGGDNRRDELISGKFLQGKYPASGYGNRPMRAVEAAKRSPGDFAYYSVDENGDGIRESYWLVLLGALDENYYYDGMRIVYVLGPDAGLSQQELAQAFAQYWQQLSGTQLAFTPAFLNSQTGGQSEFAAAPPESMLAGPPAEEVEPAPQPVPDDSAEQLATTALPEPVEIATAPSSVEELQPIVPAAPAITEEPAPAVAQPPTPAVVVDQPPAAEPEQPTSEQVAAQAVSAGAEVIAGAEQIKPETAPTEPAVAPEPASPQPPAFPEPEEPLVVYSYGWD